MENSLKLGLAALVIGGICIQAGIAIYRKLTDRERLFDDEEELFADEVKLQLQQELEEAIKASTKKSPPSAFKNPDSPRSIQHVRFVNPTPPRTRSDNQYHGLGIQTNGTENLRPLAAKPYMNGITHTYGQRERLPLLSVSPQTSKSMPNGYIAEGPRILFVNAKQHDRILKRRETRERLGFLTPVRVHGGKRSIGTRGPFGMLLRQEISVR